MDLKDIDLFLFDLDGTLYLENEVIAGADKTVAALRAAGKKVCFLTNNSSRSSEENLKKLAGLGFKPEKSELCSSAHAAADYLIRAKKTENVYFLAPAAVRREFAEDGVNIIDYAENKRIQESAGPFTEYTVVVGFDTELTYDNLRTACRLLEGGAGFVATHPDKNCPVQHGTIPDTGSFLTLIRSATGRKPDIICGKPYQTISEYLLRKYGIKDRRRVCMVGDRLSTDIQFGVKNKLPTVLVMTGETTEDMLKGSKIKPDFVLQDVNQLLNNNIPLSRA